MESEFSMSDDMTMGLCKVSTCTNTCPDNLQIKYNAIYTVGERIHVNIDYSEQVSDIQQKRWINSF